MCLVRIFDEIFLHLCICKNTCHDFEGQVGVHRHQNGVLVLFEAAPWVALPTPNVRTGILNRKIFAGTGVKALVCPRVRRIAECAL